MKAKPIIKKLNSDGYFIWDQFLEDDQAVKLRNKLEKLLKFNKNSSRYWADKENSDNRIYGRSYR